MDIDLDLYGRNISMLFSGGADSSLLFYLVGSKIVNQHKDKTLTLFLIDRPNNPIVRATHIHSIIEKKLNFKFELIKLHIPKIPYFKQVLFASKIIELKNEFNSLLWGINKYTAHIKPIHIFNFKETNFLKFPFKEYTKDALIKEYFNLNIEDVLYQTHSCGLNLEEPCKTCFNCKERKWAFEKLNIEANFGI